MVEAASRSTSSPTTWPWRSLNCLKLSRSTISSARGPLSSLATCRDNWFSKYLRLPTSVSGSVMLEPDLIQLILQLANLIGGGSQPVHQHRVGGLNVHRPGQQFVDDRLQPVFHPSERQARRRARQPGLVAMGRIRRLFDHVDQRVRLAVHQRADRMDAGDRFGRIQKLLVQARNVTCARPAGRGQSALTASVSALCRPEKNVYHSSKLFGSRARSSSWICLRACAEMRFFQSRSGSADIVISGYYSFFCQRTEAAKAAAFPVLKFKPLRGGGALAFRLAFETTGPKSIGDQSHRQQYNNTHKAASAAGVAGEERIS